MGKGDSCCTQLCKRFLVFVNTIVLLCGLAIVGTSIYLIVEQYQGRLFSGSDAVWVVWTPFVLGIIICIMSLTACCVAIEEKKCMLGCFALLQLVVGIVVVVSASALLLYIGYMETISTTSANTLDAGVGDTQWDLSDYTTGLYVACCEPSLKGTIGACPDALTSNQDPLYAICYRDRSVFDSGLNVDGDTCDAVRTDPLNLCPTNGETGGVGLKAMQSSTYEYLKDYFFPSGVAFVVFGVFLLLASVGSCVVGCGGGKKKNKRKNGSHQQQQQQQGAGAPTQNGGITMV